MNLSHIEEKSFQMEIDKFWAEWQKQKVHYKDIGIWWDLGKTYIKHIARKQVIDDIKFERDYPQPDRERIENLVSKLKEIDIEKQKKIFISTHNEVIEPGERPSKYFFNQLKSKQTKQSMSVLQNGGGELLTDQGDILSETVNYYTKLHTEEENLEKHKLRVRSATHHKRIIRSPRRYRE